MDLCNKRIAILILLTVVTCFQVKLAVADVYMHTPRGSNNRNCRNDANNANRQNGNRLFDSQNNDKGGYSCPRSFPFACYRYEDGSEAQATCNAYNTENPSGDMIDEDGQLVHPQATINPRMYYYADSILTVEWTNQHGSGNNEKVHSDVVVQISCEGDEMMSDDCGDANLGRQCHPRDGTPVNNNDGDNTNDQATTTIPEQAGTTQHDQRYGRHETYRYYKKCRNRERNKGLFIADENVNGNSARYTRQNPNGNRYGLECPEEAVYWPYWHPSPWIDLAVLTSDVERCEEKISQSQNVISKWECVCSGDGCPTGEGQLPNNEFKCKDYQTNNPDVNIEWVETEPFSTLGAAKPACLEAQFSRDNHLGNVGGSGFTYGYNLTIPSYLAGKKSCVLRIRYNISTGDHNDLSVIGTAANNTPDAEDATGITGAMGYIFDRDNSPTKVYEECDLGEDQFGHLGLAINSNQYGRVFQDRSYVFSIKEKPSNVSCSRIYNLGVRGKRGNIVQAYPAVEYDFTPNNLMVTDADCIHIQWAGSDYNPNRNPNNGEGGPPHVNDNDQSRADRSNIVPMEVAADNRPCCSESCAGWNMFNVDRKTWKRLMYLDQPVLQGAGSGSTGYEGCATPQQLFARYDTNNGDERRRMEYNSTNCAKLSGMATPYFDAGLVKPGAPGTYKYMSSRNNNFSNRGMKGSLTITGAPLSVAAIAGIAVASVVVVAALGSLCCVFGGVGCAGVLAAVGLGAAAKKRSTKGDKQVVSSAPHETVVSAAFDYTAQESGELTFKAGDKITVISKDPSGWWEGKLNSGLRGIFPANYVSSVQQA